MSIMPPKENIAEESVLNVTDATTKIKQIIVNATITKKDPTQDIAKVINKCIEYYTNPDEKECIRKALIISSRKWLYEINQMTDLLITNMTVKLMNKQFDLDKLKSYGLDFISLMTGNDPKTLTNIRPFLEGTKHTIVPIIEEYRKSYQQVIKTLSVEPPKVVDYTRKNGKQVVYTMSLRNRAEMNVRYHANMDDLEKQRNSDNKLVWISTHPNCSPRCKPFQGKLYSLDGTSGTIDGIRYVPLEVALKGTFKNGNGCISGYNCRHRTIPYTKGSIPPNDYTNAEIKKEYSIDQKQRAFENNIRQLKTEEKLLREAGNTKQASKVRKQWRAKSKDYEIYSLGNNRAFYRWRAVVSKDEKSYEMERMKEK